jgi:FAD synthetase
LEKEKKKKVILASGVFDLLHYGHVYYLTNAKKIGEDQEAELIVIVAKDKNVEKLKGEKPIMPEDQRRALVESLKVVDTAILGYEDLDMIKVIEKIKPDVIALGYDEEKLEKKLKNLISEKSINIQVTRVSKFKEKDLVSSSKIKQKIIEKYKSNQI